MKLAAVVCGDCALGLRAGALWRWCMECAGFSVELYMCVPLIWNIWLRGTTRVLGVGVVARLCVRILEDGVNILFVYLRNIFFRVTEKCIYLCVLGGLSSGFWL